MKQLHIVHSGLALPSQAPINQLLLKSLEIMPEAIVPARPPVDSAEPAKFDAWPNLSHLEKASVFVTVKLSAITKIISILCKHEHGIKPTNKRQPDEL